MRSLHILCDQGPDLACGTGSDLTIAEPQEGSVIFHRDYPSAFSGGRPDNNALRHGEGKVYLVDGPGIGRIIDSDGKFAAAPNPDFFRGEGHFDQRRLCYSSEGDARGQKNSREKGETTGQGESAEGDWV